MKTELKGFMKIFHFTFRQQTMRKGWLVSTILVAVLCFAIPFGVLTGSAWFGKNEPEGVPETGLPVGELEYSEEDGQSAAGEETVLPDLSALKQVFVVNLTGLSEFSAETMTESLLAALPGMDFIDYSDQLELARIDSKDSDNTLILVAGQEKGAFVLHLLTPEDSRLQEGIAEQLVPLLSAYAEQAAAEINEFNGVVAEEDGSESDSATADGDSADGASANGDSAGEAAETDDPLASIHQVLGMVIPYLNIMILYFFVLFYGQGVAQSVITEKTSKLMEFFLVSVKPSAMILGKLTAVCLCGIIQLGSWILCLILGFVLGGSAAVAIDGSAQEMLVLQLMDTFGEAASGMFSVSGIVLALLMVLAGTFLYCSLAAVGGALAGKPEDLSSTNVVFTLVLVASFFACLLAGGLEGLDGGAAWLDWIPFTAIMVTPARILLGSVSVVKGFASLVIVILTAFLITVAAGQLYRMMALYKGQVPGPKKLMQMIKEK